MSEKIKYSDDEKRLALQIANSACRLEKMLELGAPLELVENERQLLAGRVARFPVFDVVKE